MSEKSKKEQEDNGDGLVEVEYITESNKKSERIKSKRKSD